MEFEILGFEIKESKNQDPVRGIWNPQREICLELPYMGRMKAVNYVLLSISKNNILHRFTLTCNLNDLAAIK